MDRDEVHVAGEDYLTPGGAVNGDVVGHDGRYVRNLRVYSGKKVMFAPEFARRRVIEVGGRPVPESRQEQGHRIRSAQRQLQGLKGRMAAKKVILVCILEEERRGRE